MTRIYSNTLWVLVALLLAACGGGGGGGDGGPKFPIFPPLPPGNSAPNLPDSSFNVDEDAMSIGTVIATDPDGDALSYTLAAGDASLFEVSSDGTITVVSGQSLDYGNQPYVLDIQVDDSEGNNDQGRVTVNVNNPSAPFGLDTRPANLSHNFPASAPATTSLGLQVVHQGLNAPVHYAQVPGTNIRLALEQRGTIRWYNGQTLNPGGVFMTVPDAMPGGFEDGLFSIAFDPDFASNGFFYLAYTSHHNNHGQNCVNELPVNHYNSCSVIARFRLATAAGGAFIYTQGDASTKTYVLIARQPDDNHNGGTVTFGTDGYLYITFGDGGGTGFGNSQNRGNLMGSILRIDVSSLPYSIPPSNPFAGNGSGYREEIYAYGFRNPWRMSIDATSGQMWVGDVGQGSLEEIDLVSAGGNYGWDHYEGTQGFNNPGGAPAGVIFPVLEYGRSDGTTVVGGNVYRGSDLNSWQGLYFFADQSGTIWTLNPADVGGTVTKSVAIASNLSITSFATDSAQELYVTDFGSGTIQKIVSQGSGGGSIPSTLSATGVFSDVGSLTPATGLLPYDVNAALWSDGTAKLRWFYVPGGDTIGFDADNPWTLPVGSMVVKHFAMPMVDDNLNTLRRLETRVLFHHTEGWRGYTYRWNSAQTEANLISSQESETLTIENSQGGTRQQLYTYPSRNQCLACHNNAAGPMLGLRTAQMNGNYAYSNAVDNQLRTLNHIAMFDTNLGDPGNYPAFLDPSSGAGSLDGRARAYLDVNCSVCHRPGAQAPTNMDLRASTALNATNALEVNPSSGSVGIINAKIIAMGSKERSVLWERMRRTDNNRMPPDISHRVDQDAVDLIGAWIDSL